MKCDRCDGCGIDPEPAVYPTCCNRNRDNCGGSGCTGPDPALEPQQCQQCGGTGEIVACVAAEREGK